MLCFTECDFSLLLLIGVLLIGGDKYQKMELDIVGVMVNQLVSSEVDSEFEPWLVKPKTIKLVFVTSPLSTQH